MLFTETNIYILSKLAALVRRQTGTRHHLSSQSSIVELLKVSSRLNDERIASYYARFVDDLTSEQVKEFTDAGLTVTDQATANQIPLNEANLQNTAANQSNGSRLFRVR